MTIKEHYRLVLKKYNILAKRYTRVKNIVDETIKTELMTSYLNIIGLVPFSHKNNKTLDNVYEYKDKIEEVVDDSLCEFERADGSFERIFPLKDNVYYYKKVFESPGKENELLWEKLKDFV